MDNLQWFKFSPANWLMGRIQRQPAQVQLDFINLCCKYWNKEGLMSIEDAQLDIMDSYEPLLKYKIIKEDGDNVVIDFLDEQLSAIEDKRKQASEAGKRSAAARKRRTKPNEPPTTVEPTLNDRPTESNREEKSREEESREEEEIDITKPDLFQQFWDLYNNKLDRVKCEKEWFKIDNAEYHKIIEHVPKFVQASGEYLCKPINYLTGRRWQDEQLPNYNKTPQPETQKLVPYKMNPPKH
jgi:hypothetical protein